MVVEFGCWRLGEGAWDCEKKIRDSLTKGYNVVLRVDLGHHRTKEITQEVGAFVFVGMESEMVRVLVEGTNG
ncbi:hypothetical protein VNO80_22480 [Phaseolus coccineus]|uniref:Uncharacterized protein n=1 Tax=Phaseolus coccineus TaxID=3886 RepID=A0AAN9M4Z1_PHACN